MQNTEELINATKDHKEAIDAAANALKEAAASSQTAEPETPVAPQPVRVQRLAIYTADVPWPVGATIRELEIEVPYPAECVKAMYHLQRPNPLLIQPDEEPRPLSVLRLAFTGSPDAPKVKRHIIAQPAGSAFGFPEGMPEEIRPALVDVVMNPLSGSTIAVWVDPPDSVEPTEIPFFEAKPLEPEKVEAKPANDAEQPT